MNGDIARLGDGIGIRLAEVEFVAAVGLGLDGAAHGVGHGHLSVFRRGHGKGQGAGGKFAQRDGLVHIGINGDAPRLGLVAELADSVGVFRALFDHIGIYAGFLVGSLGAGWQAALFQFYRGIRGSRGKGNDRLGGEFHRLGHIRIGHRDLAGGGLIVLLADGVGVSSGGNGVFAAASGQFVAAFILQFHLVGGGSCRKGDGISRRNGKILEPDIVTISIFVER